MRKVSLTRWQSDLRLEKIVETYSEELDHCRANNPYKMLHSDWGMLEGYSM